MRANELDCCALVSVLHAALLELGLSLVPHDKVLAAIHEAIIEPVIVRRETWGTGPAAEEGLRAMMDLVGGPAPLRDQ